jgi:branched-chain amino acid transport system permease protein
LDPVIAIFLAQDGVTNGAIYALLSLSLILVFTVTRVIFIPQGEFVAYGALTLFAIEKGMVPGTAYLPLALGVISFASMMIGEPEMRARRRALEGAASNILLPAAILLVTLWLVPMRLGVLVNVALTLLILTPLGPFIYRIVYRPLAEASVLVLLIASVGVHLAMVGLGLVFFGPEGFRTTPFSRASFNLGPMIVTGQSLWILGIAATLIAGFWFFFGYTLAGKALRATASNRLGARLVGIPAARSGRIAFGMAAAAGTLSGILIGPATTVFYDTGFITGLKGFVAAIIGGLVSFPLGAAAAILVGLVESFSSFWASTFKEVIVFTTIMPVLLWQSFRAVHIEGEE